MKIAAIASMPFDLELACFGTLSRCIKDGHEVHIIIAKSNEDKTGWTQIKMDILRKISHKIGVSQVYFTDRFDYSSVTQDNATVLASFLKTINPSLVIMPFWKTSSQKRKILAKTSLIACRGIGSILMYELERNTSFLPNVYFIVSADEFSMKTSCLGEHGSLVNELALDGKANCFNLDLVTMKKYQLPIFPQTSTSLEHAAGPGSMMPRSDDQQLIFANNATAEIVSQEHAEIDQHNKRGTHRDIKQRQTSHGVYSQGTGMNVLVEVFESHRMLLVDHDDGL